MSDSASRSKYPPWMLRFNRTITSRPFTYLAAAFFVLDGVSRLVDGRIFRGIANLAVAAALIALRQRTRRAALGEPKPAERRAEWIAAHPVVGALLGGAAWGAAMSVFFIITKEGSILRAVIIGLGSGILLFGPFVAILTRRYRAPGERDRRR